MVVMSEAEVAVEVSRSTPAFRNAGAHVVRSPSPRVVPTVPWVTSLAPHDLRTLLSVIENQVLPRLIADYAPAVCSPLPER